MLRKCTRHNINIWAEIKKKATILKRLPSTAKTNMRLGSNGNDIESTPESFYNNFLCWNGWNKPQWFDYGENHTQIDNSHTWKFVHIWFLTPHLLVLESPNICTHLISHSSPKCEHIFNPFCCRSHLPLRWNLFKLKFLQTLRLFNPFHIKRGRCSSFLCQFHQPLLNIIAMKCLPTLLFGAATVLSAVSFTGSFSFFKS